MKPKPKIAIIGGGIAGLSVAALLGHTQKFDITLFEKNDYLGGRMGMIEAQGFKFDKGPSWYLMPDVFDHFFDLLGEKTSDHLNLTRLSPSYKIFFETEKSSLSFESDPEKVAQIFEKLEPGSGNKFKQYLKESENTYNLAMKNYIYKNYNSPKDLLGGFDYKNLPSPKLLSSMHSYIKRYFSNEKIIRILEYQLVFLGSSPYKAPALYNLMNHIDFNQGVFYPQGGMFEISKAVGKLAEKRGVLLKTNSGVSKINCKDNNAYSLTLENGDEIAVDYVISASDYHHTETKLLSEEYRQYSQNYWSKRVLAPSAHIMYLGLNKKYSNLVHHNLLFAKNWEQNFEEIFSEHTLSKNPSVYICAPSKTDASVAPQDHENLFVLTPISPKVEMTKHKQEEYGETVLTLLENELDLKLKEHIVYRQDYSTPNFHSDYNTLGGSALGLAHTLNQSLFMRPHNVSKKVNNLFFTGQTTNPGIGVPMQLISAELVVKLLFNQKNDGKPLSTLSNLS